MEGEALKQGKARVASHLIEPLERAGLRRKGNVKLEDHQAFLDRLQARLAYMGEDDLATLAEVVEVHASGKNRDTWPKEVSICNWARRIALPPPSESRLVRSYLQSAAGQAAFERGEHVELFQWLRKYGAPPPENYGWSEIARLARENRDRRARIRRESERGCARPADQEWLDRYWQADARCRAIIEDKQSQQSEGQAA